jgi:hypothetical protein
MREKRKETETHHIDLDPSNNITSNLIELSTGDHMQLHAQLDFFMDSWELGLSKKDFEFRLFIRHFMRTGELAFNREALRYELNPKEGGILEEYERTLNLVGISPKHIPPDYQTLLMRARAKVFAKKEFLERLREEAKF